MRIKIIPQIVLLAAAAVADDLPQRPPMLVADALGWYSIWMTTDGTHMARQACRGELRTGIYSFRCDPIGVVVSATADDFGRCLIGNLRPSVEPDDGLRVNLLPHLVLRGRTTLPLPAKCGELPTSEGRFEFTVTPRLRNVDKPLTDAVRVAAIAFMRRARDWRAVLRLPAVRTGDPFAHVYCLYDGVLEAVMEFSIRSGQVADFPHFTYDVPHKNMPLGAERRLAEPGLWSGVSLPEEREKRRP